MMIAKRVSRGKTKDSFKRLGLYILGTKEKSPPLLAAGAGGGGTWLPTAAYVLDLPGGGHRVGKIRITNCAAAEAADAIAEIQATQAMNVRAKGDKTYHLVVSFPPGEHPSEAQLQDIEDQLCAAIGLGDHQRISAVHTDTDHLHIHIAINQIHPATRRYIEPYYDKRKLMAACDRLEISHGLVRTNHGKKQGEAMRGRGADMEAHSGQEALTRWIRANALGDIQACLRSGQDWQALHSVLATYDLEIRPRGAGLVLATADGTVMVRASRFSRALSMDSLTKRWGKYTAIAGAKPAAKMRYERAQKRKTIRSARLWEEYQQQRIAAKAARDLGRERFAALLQGRWESLREWKEKRANLVHRSTELTAAGREHRWIRYKLDVAIEERKLGEWKREQSAAVNQSHPLPSWFGFLQDKANGGNTEALAILRDREEQQHQAAQAFAVTVDEGTAKHVVYEALRPDTRKNGQVVYRLRDGGQVVDSSAGMRVEVVTPHALFLTLSLQADRSPNKAVALGGDATFQQQMVEMAAAKKMSLTFADPALECRRCELLGLPQPASPPSPQAGLMTRIGQFLSGTRLKPRRI